MRNNKDIRAALFRYLRALTISEKGPDWNERIIIIIFFGRTLDLVSQNTCAVLYDTPLMHALDA